MGPELLVLFTTKPLIVVAFALKQLLEVRSAVKFTVHCSVTAQAVEGSREHLGQGGKAGWGGREVGRPEQGRGAPEFGVAVFATETGVVENELVCH